MKNNSSNNVVERQSNRTPEGTYTKSMIKRYKLFFAINDVAHNVTNDDMNSFKHRKSVKRLINSIKIYRGTVHKVYDRKLPKVFRNSAHYFADYFKITPKFSSMPADEATS